jgi:RNA polymerase sigma-70 factor (ECF subfamily)
LHRYLLRRLRNPQQVDDLAQDVYERLLKIDDKKIVEKPLAYLYGVSSHVLCDFRIDAEAEKAHVTYDSETADDWEDSPGCVLPDTLADRLNLQQQIDKALAQLPPTHAAILLAHKRDGLSYEEVAEKLNLSIHTVEKYVTQAKARLRAMSWDR